MESRSFCYWLQGLFELADPTTLNERQVDLIKKHLNMVFVHEIDPSYGDKEKQDKLDEIHNGPMKSPSPFPNPNIMWMDGQPMINSWSKNFGINIDKEHKEMKQELHNIHTPDPEPRPRC